MRFSQIMSTGSAGELFALDEHGQLWRYAWPRSTGNVEADLKAERIWTLAPMPEPAHA